MTLLFQRMRLVHTLNNTAIASPRILAPLPETHQTAEGRVRLPARLRGWFGGAEFLRSDRPASPWRGGRAVFTRP